MSIMGNAEGKIGRNDPCPCGSGLKYKRCCANNPMALFPRHTPERRHHWSQGEIAQISTGKIIEKLGMCGIPVTEEEFLKDVEECRSADDIYERWKARSTITAEGFDGDFPWMAADVLWRRLAPAKISTEQLDDMMQDGYDLIAKKDEIGGCVLWLKVWDELKLRFTSEMRKVEDAKSVFAGGQSLFNWCQDVEMELGNAALDDPAFHDRRILYCGEFCRYFPESHDIVPHMKWAIADALFLSDRAAAAEREFQALVEAYPRDPWGYINWGDMHRGFAGRAGNPERAEELYRKALGIDPKEDDTILERIRDLKKG